MKNVLVFPCGSEIGLEINKALAYSTHFKLYGGNSVDDHGKFVYKNYISDIPFIDKPNFIHSINQIVEQYEIDFIIPAHDSAVLKLSECQNEIKAVIVTSNLDTCKLCRSKKATYEKFKSLLPTPFVYNHIDDFHFPIFLKPDVGQGSKGTFKVTQKKELDFYIEKDPSLLALEYLPGKEYTIDCFTDTNRKLLFAEGRERVRINNGISVNSIQIKNPKFRELAEIINQTITLHGVWFFQVKERINGELVLMEIAPRIAGTMALFRVTGINFIQLSLFDRMGYPIDILNNNLEVVLDRALFSRYSIKLEYSYVYIDFDDTIIINSSVNPDVIRFLYQEKNMGKKLILITKHKKDINTTLNEFAISNFLFDEILWLKEGDKKSCYIKNHDSIFIDDSFSERREVFDALGIPVFSIDAIESLLYWKV